MAASSLPRLLLHLLRSVTLRCPHCREGRLLRNYYAAHERCGVCGLHFQRDEGDFWGGMVFSYTFGGIAGFAMAALLLELGIDAPETLAYAAAGAAVMAILALFPFAKALWIYLLYLTRGHYDEYRPPGAATQAHDDAPPSR